MFVWWATGTCSLMYRSSARLDPPHPASASPVLGGGGPVLGRGFFMFLCGFERIIAALIKSLFIGTHGCQMNVHDPTRWLMF